MAINYDEDIIYEIDVDFYGLKDFNTVYTKQYDENSRYIVATVWKDGSVYNIPEGAMAFFSCTKPRGSGIFNPCTIVDGKIVYGITLQTTIEYGTFGAEFRLYKSDVDVNGVVTQKKLSTPNFKIFVDKSALDDSTVISTNEFNALTNAMNSLGDLTSDVNDAVARANTAIANAETATNNAIDATTNANTSATNANIAKEATILATTNANNAIANINDTNSDIQAEELIRQSQETTRQSNTNTVIATAENAIVRTNIAAQNAEDIVAGVGVVMTSEKGAINGVATLDGTGKVPSTQLPTIASTASDITYSNVTSGLTATNAQTAIDELDSIIGNKSLLNTASNTDLVGAVNEVNTKFLESTGYGVMSGLLVTAQSTPDMTINVSSGSARMSSGKTSTVANNKILHINTADSTNNRKDIIYLNSSGVVSYLAGTSLSVKSIRTYTVTTNFAVNDTMSINIAKFIATTSTTNATNFAVGATIANTITNIVAALNANTTITDLYTVSTSGNTFTLTEKASGSGFAPSIAVFTGTGVVNSGTPTNSVNAVPPTTPTGGILLAIIKVGVGATSIQSNNITDKRIMVKSNTALAEETYAINNMLKDLSMGSIMNKIRKGLSVKIVCYGDSITRGYYTTTPWTTLLQNDLRWTFNNNNINVINSAIGGAFASDGANSNNFQTAVAEYIPDMCIIAYGMNDQISSFAINDYKNNIISMIRLCKQNNILACVMTPTPCFVEPYNKYGDSYALACIEACKKECVQCIDLYSGFYAAYQNHFMRPTDIADLVHPGDSGAHFIKNKIETDLFEYLYIKDTIDIPLSRTRYATTDLTNHYPDNNIFFGETVVMNKSGATGTFLRMNFFVDAASTTISLNVLTYENGGTYNIVMDGVSIPVNTTTVSLIPETYIQLGVVGYGMHTISVLNTGWVTGGEELHMISVRAQIIDQSISDILSRINGTVIQTDTNLALIAGVYTITPSTLNTPVAAYGILTVKTGNDGTWLFHDIVTSAGIKYSRYNINNAGWSTWV